MLGVVVLRNQSELKLQARYTKSGELYTTHASQSSNTDSVSSQQTDSPDCKAYQSTEICHKQESCITKVRLIPHTVKLPSNSHQDNTAGQAQQVVIEDLQREHDRINATSMTITLLTPAKPTIENSPSRLPSLVCCATLSIADRMYSE
jgi:hypothetical protein